MRAPARLCSFGLLCLLACLPCAHAARAAYRWERIAVTRVLPSQVFNRLGLTHLTRRGYTRDGAKKGDPDPTFPDGLTDVVPSDTERVLLVRGTPEGLTQFRARVDAMQTQIAGERWHVTAQLVRPDAAGDAPLGEPVSVEAPDDAPLLLALGPADVLRSYQLRVHVEAGGALSVSCQTGITLPAPVAPVWTPSAVWLPGASRPVLPGTLVLFEDTAAARRLARQKMGLPPEPTAEDYAVRVTVTPVVPVAAASSPNVGTAPAP